MGSESIGYRLKEIRKFLELSQDEISRNVEVTNQTLSRYENGARFPDSQFLQKFGREYNVNANWLLYGNGDMFLKDQEESSAGNDTGKKLKYYLRKIEELFLEKKQEQDEEQEEEID
ncbi:MAG: helix-turn-helix transcriptional regulator [Candidatus Aminicenantes bacterium]|nr:helix-turn-helix transcriptional regulator [Candidatus Aminicenantes bacterium]